MRGMWSLLAVALLAWAVAAPAGAATPDALIRVQAAGATAPTVEYDPAKLPPPVRALRQQLMDLAKQGDIEKLRPLLKPGSPNLASTQNEDPIDFLKSQSGDDNGREILAILLEVLEAGFVHADEGTSEEAYVWPYFARMPIDKLTGPQMVELFKLITAGDYEDMKNFGAYIFYRTAIKPDGTWEYFIAGD